jgi:dipeptidyl aminopeptidase/acylaminoacyl peptidase
MGRVKLLRAAFRGRHANTLLLLGIIFAVGLSGAHAKESPLFTVGDAIEMTHLVDPDETGGAIGDVRDFRFSPDRGKFAVVLRKGNVKSGRNRYDLRLYDVDTIRKHMHARSGGPAPFELLATMESSVERSLYFHAIDGVTWLRDGRTIFFIGTEGDSTAQVYAVNVATRRLTRLTNHKHDVATADVSADGSTVLFSAYTPKDWTQRNQRGFVVRSENINEVISTDPEKFSYSNIKYFVQTAHDKLAHEIGAPPGYFPLPNNIHLSPDGCWAVVFLTATELERTWLEYKPVKALFTRGTSKERASPLNVESASSPLSEATGEQAPALGSFLLVNTATREARRLIDAPALLEGAYIERVTWSPDSKRVLVGPTFLPLTDTNGAERTRRLEERAIAEIELASMHARFAWASATGQGEGLTLLPKDWLPSGRVHAEAVSTRRERVYEIEFQKSGGKWLPIGAPQDSAASFQLSIRSDLNVPPEIEARDGNFSATAIITDLNPQLRHKAMGKLIPYTWSDESGRTYSGGLMLPVAYHPEKRYPVVLQTYGFDPKEFLVSGPSGLTSAYAARALASYNIMVLQMPDVDTSPTSEVIGDNERYWQHGENPRFIEMMEAAIQALDRDRYIDAHKVGLIGHSRAGMHVHAAITFGNSPIAAAVIADAAAATPIGQTLWYGSPNLLEFETHTLMGKPFWGDGINQWLERSPAFHLDNIRAAVRYEFHGGGAGVLAHWDSFVFLKRHRRPVELIEIPIADHNPLQPFALYTSQQGTVDWFRFWLRGEEDGVNEKVEQYSRWRKLRDSQADAYSASERRGYIPNRSVTAN